MLASAVIPSVTSLVSVGEGCMNQQQPAYISSGLAGLLKRSFPWKWAPVSWDLDPVHITPASL